MGSFFSGFGGGINSGMENVMAMQRALIAAGQLGLESEPVMKKKLGPGMVEREGKVYRSSSPLAGGGEVLGNEVPEAEYMVSTGKNKYSFVPNPMNKMLRQAEFDNLQRKPYDQAADFAAKYARGVVGQYGALSDPDAYDKAFTKGYDFYSKLSGLRGMMGAPNAGAGNPNPAMQQPNAVSIPSNGYDPKTGDAVGSAVAPNLDAEVAALEALPPDKQEYVVQTLMQSQEPVDQAILALLAKKKAMMTNSANPPDVPMKIPGINKREDDVFAGTPWPAGY